MDGKGRVRREGVLVLGITGGVACGKSTVLRILAELGAYPIDADRIAHRVLAAGSPAVGRVARELGEMYVRPDGSVDRQALGRRVFADPEARRRLEAIVHPPVLEEIEEEIRRARERGFRVIAAEIPLLFEAGLADRVDRILVVACSPERQRERLIRRDGLTPGEAESRVRSQWPVQQKIPLADWVIETDGGLDETRRQVEEIWKTLASDGRR